MHAVVVWLYTHCPRTAGNLALRDGPGGFAVVIEREGYDLHVISGGEDRADTGPERLELLALTEALDTLPLPQRVVIRSQSQRLRYTLAGRTLPAYCADLRDKLTELIQYHDVSCDWSSGYGGLRPVAYCRELAEKAAQDVILNRDNQYLQEISKWQEERERRAAMKSFMRPAVHVPLSLPSEFPK